MPRLVAQTGQHTVEVAGRLIIRSVCPGDLTAKVRHTFDFPVEFPGKVLKVVKPLFKRVEAVVRCEERSWEEWAQLIRKATPDPLIRAWAASIAWWDYGQDSADNPITEMAKPLPVDFKGNDKELGKVLKRIGYPTPEDRVNQLPVARGKINRALADLGSPKVTIRQ